MIAEKVQAEKIPKQEEARTKKMDAEAQEMPVKEATAVEVISEENPQQGNNHPNPKRRNPNREEVRHLAWRLDPFDSKTLILTRNGVDDSFTFKERKRAGEWIRALEAWAVWSPL